jgi:hypothetical protein
LIDSSSYEVSLEIFVKSNYSKSNCKYKLYYLSQINPRKMSNNPDQPGKHENYLIGNILADGTFTFTFLLITFIDPSEDFFSLRAEMGKSISAPPPGLRDSVK